MDTSLRHAPRGALWRTCPSFWLSGVHMFCTPALSVSTRPSPSLVLPLARVVVALVLPLARPLHSAVALVLPSALPGPWAAVLTLPSLRPTGHPRHPEDNKVPA